MLRRAALYDLISAGDIPAVLDELTQAFKDDVLNKLLDEYVVRKDNYDGVDYVRRLRAFINLKIPADRVRTIGDDDFYDALCQLDFKVQSDNFEGIYKHKRVVAFLLHGENSSEGNDIKWLYNQLLHVEDLSGEDRTMTIDCNAQLISSFNDLLNELFEKFDVDTKKETRQRHLVILSKKIEGRLKSGPFVCIIKSPESILGSEIEVRNLIDQFLSFMNLQIVENNNNPFILFFVENEVADYKHADDKYFFWYKDEVKDIFTTQAIAHADVRIYDLSPIADVGEADVVRWVKWTQKRPDYYDKAKCFAGQECDALVAGKKPYEVIHAICSALNIKIDPKWIV